MRGDSVESSRASVVMIDEHWNVEGVTRPLHQDKMPLDGLIIWDRNAGYIIMILPIYRSRNPFPSISMPNSPVAFSHRPCSTP